MDQVEELLELLNTLIFSYVDNIFTFDIATLTDVRTCLQDSLDKIEFLQLESQLQQEEIQQKNHHYELVLVQKNCIFEEDDDVDSNQQPLHKKLSEHASYMNENEVKLPFSKLIIKPWEEIRHTKHRTCIRYEKEVTFHIPDDNKPIQFQSVGLLQENSYSPAPIQEQILICQHCQRVGHMEYQCFDLHPCDHCGKHNHPSNKCSYNKKYARVRNHYGWITSW
jgi:hypothetical protein